MVKAKSIFKLFSVLMSVSIICMLLSVIPIEPITVSAICCRKDGFDKSKYSLTGNMAEDVATIAKSQKGRTEAQFGYSGVDAGAWCDEFVADCIENAGADSSIVGHGGTVANFEQVMRNKGAVQVSFPKTGDLIFFTKSHVEIVTKIENGVVYCAGGNNGGRMCKGERTASSVGTTRLYLRPNYPVVIKKWYEDLTPVNLGECFDAYIINTEVWKHLTVEDNDNVMITSENKKSEQIWHFTRKFDGSYTIINCKTGKALDGGGTDDNLYTYAACDNGWQSWNIYGSSGEYYLKPQESDYVIDIQGGFTNDGTNVQIYEYNETSAQKFQIYMLDSLGELGAIQNLGDKFTAYIINTEASKHLTVEDNDNVIITSENRKAEQMWCFTRKSDGSYTIINCKTGKALDGGGTDGNLYTYTACDNGWQSWYIFGSSGKYILKSQSSNAVIDLQGGYTEDDTNVQTFQPNGTYAQKFDIIKVIKGDINADGEIDKDDVVILQKWLLGSCEMTNWQTADLCQDGMIDVYDLIMLRKLISDSK